MAIKVGGGLRRLKVCPGHLGDREIQSLVNEPPGTLVVLAVAPGTPVPLAIDDLRDRAAGLSINVESACPVTRQRWLDALQYGVANLWLAHA